ncbi:MAG: hypothetical protein A2046_09695, partial [Bacteroidetes bacterium GWA2_30_7]
TTLFENDTIKMWYGGVGSDMKARICYAFSLDGINWTKHNSPVIDLGIAGEWDSGWLDTPEIVKDNTGYKMYYYGDTIQQFAAISSAIGVATSNDGINWYKHPNNPIFTKGNVGEWDGSWVESTNVNFDTVTGEYKMWYNGVDTTTWKINIGLATSTDGVNWSKYVNNPVVQTGNWGEYDDMWLGTPTVLKMDNFYEMWYSATSTNSYNYVTASFDTVSICYATSIDGINWLKHSNNPLFHTFTAPYDSLVDRGGPWAPSVIFNPNTNSFMMWFEAHGGNSNFNISLATAPKTNTNIVEYHSMESDIIVYPNPFSETTTLEIINWKNQNYELKIYDLFGREERTHKIINQKTEILKSDLSSGIHFYQLKDNKQNISSGKLIIQ